MKGRKKSIETRRKMSIAQLGNKKTLGKKLSDETKRKMSLAKKGWIPSAEARARMSIGQRNRLPATVETRLKQSQARKGKKFSNEHRKRLGESKMGEKSHFWKGGATRINQVIRSSIEYRFWREAVFKRDNYTCVWCGAKSTKGVKVTLNADHIKPFALFPELRFAIDNGRTLCTPCHLTTDTYGFKQLTGFEF